MVTRIVITLVIAMLVCFVFNKKIMDFFRLPVDQVIRTQIEETLPKDAPKLLTVDLWGQARKVEHAAMNLVPEQRAIFYQTLGDETLVFHAKSISLLRAATVLPEAKRGAFVDSLTEPNEFKQQVKALLKSKPNTDNDAQGNLKMMSALKPTEGFMLSMKLSFVAGIVVSFPLLLLFILQFVLPGLHSSEKRVLWPAMTVGFGLFLAGTAFAYYMVLPRTLLFFYQWSGDMGISNDWRIGEYISFATQFTLLFGASFELPVVVMVFVKLGLLSYETMSKTRSYAIVGIFVAAAILTPTPDAFTLMIMALPMIVLYEICIWLAYFDRKKARLREEQEAREREERMLLAEEKRAAAMAEDDARDAKWHEEHDHDLHDHDFHHHDDHSAHEAGDDGWHVDLPHEEPPTGEEPPLPEDPPLPDVPEDGERRRMDP